jgi:hypothetical protein
VVMEPGARRVPDGVKFLDAVLIEHLSHQYLSQYTASADTLLPMALQVVVLLLSQRLIHVNSVLATGFLAFLLLYLTMQASDN